MISPTKLKIMLSAEDMKKLELDDGPCADISGKAGFRSLMREARDRCGFDAVGDRVFVQYYPEKHGGCEMFVTKLDDEKRGETRARRKRQTTNLFSASTDKPTEEYIVYGFEDIKGLIVTCKCLAAAGYSGTGKAYITSEKCRKYCLVLDKENFFACENGGVLLGTAYKYFLDEHRTLFCPDAIDKLGQFE